MKSFSNLEIEGEPLKISADFDLNTQKRLCRNVVKNYWNEVLIICKENWQALIIPITKSNDTVLHLAAYNKLEDIFELLLQILPPGPDQRDVKTKVLLVKNTEGNTPLHIAASVGSVRMCQSIIDITGSETSLSARNKEGETPLFIAALHGHKGAFLYFHNICDLSEGYNYCKRNDGETILHCAISEEYFELSLTILSLYRDLVNLVNMDGMTPLHVLASKPSAFQSGSDLRWYEKIIYHSIAKTDELELLTEVERLAIQQYSREGGKDLDKKEEWKEDLKVIREIIKEDLDQFTLGGTEERKQIQEEILWEEEEIPNVEFESQPFTDEGHRSPNEVPAESKLPPNYITCSRFIKNLVPMPTVPSIVGRQEGDIENHFTQGGDPHIAGDPSRKEAHWHQFKIPPNYITCFSFVGLVSRTVLYISRSEMIRKLGEMKKRHTRSLLIMKVLLHYASMRPFPQEQETEKEHVDMCNPILIAAKNGITEIVEKAFKISPMALYDVDQDRKNIVLLTVEHKQPHVYDVLLDLKKKDVIKHTVFCEVDRNGDSALHLAAKKAEFNWPVPGAASQMQWDIKWYEYIKNTTGRKLLFVRNKNGKTSDEVFTESHEELVKQGREWLTSTSNACSVVAGLFVTVAFNTSTTVPEGIKEEKLHWLASKIFAGSSFVSFYTSLIAVIMFLSILTSGCRERDFRHALPWKLLLGLSAFNLSITSTVVCFTTGHFYIFKDQLISISSSSYVIACLLVTVFSMLVFPLYFHLVWATSTTVPQRSYRLSIPDWLFIDE